MTSKFLLGQIVMLALACTTSFANDLPMAAQPHFKLYSIAEGLNQKSVSEVTQDQDGFLWIATFGGLNRFDGSTFESFTTSQGLRQKLIQAVMADSQNRVWAGDAAGGLTLLKNSRVIRTFEPDPNVRGVARALLTVGDTLYYGTQPGGLRRLDLTDMDTGLVPIEGAPDAVMSLASRGDDKVYLMAPDGLFRYTPGRKPAFELLAEGASVLSSDGKGQIAVGHRDGRVGRLNVNDQVVWDDLRYEARVSGLVLRDGVVDWVFLEGRGMVPYGQPDAQPMLPTSGAAPAVNTAAAIYDNEGILWVPIRGGLARYLGPRFEHYPLEEDGLRPEVFSIVPDAAGGYWFGTSQGLVHVDRNGTQINVSDQLGIDRREVRSLALSRDQRTIWLAQIFSPTYGIDLESMTIRWTLGDNQSVTVGSILDDQERLWVGHYRGALVMFDANKEIETIYELGEGASIYGMDIADDGVLWFSANYEGLYRMDIRDPAARPELVVPVSDMEQEFFMDVVASGKGADTVVWLSGVQGDLLRVVNGRAKRVIDRERIDGQTLHSVQPLLDDTVIMATSRGVFRYDIRRDLLDHYTALDGFVAIESKAHAKYFDGASQLLIGTTSGVTLMDVSLPMEGVATPRPLIVERGLVGQDTESNRDEGDDGRGRTARIRYTAISTRRPGGIEYSYRLEGNEEQWSAPTTTTSNTYSNLEPGDYTFKVRARLPEGKWSDSADWSFNVPTPFWRTLWFKALAILLLSLVAWSAVQLRLRAIAKMNRRLREQVEDRTRSIEQGRHELEQTNRQLSSEIQERLKSDERREEVEARFKQAYHNSPIGMALVDTEGFVYDANPKMKALFWPVASGQGSIPLMSIVESEDRDRLQAFLACCATEQSSSSSMEVTCCAHDGCMRRINFHPSAIRDRDGQLKYLVLLANDVTESREMTDQLAYQARYDELTGLVNRREFATLLERARAAVDTGCEAFLMFLDLDQFKIVNDTCGHAAGDELLRTIAALIKTCVRREDTVARLGGDEFGLIVSSCTQEAAVRRAESIREKIKELVFHWQKETFRVGASIGVVRIGSGGIDLNELQQVADAACYAAKEAGRNRVHFVCGDQDAAHEHRGDMRFVQRLSTAIDSDNFVLFGQRIVPVAEHSPRTERFEVLLRMRDRDGQRLIPPGAFLPAAERYGLQDRIDQWVVSRLIDILRTQNPITLAKQQFWINLSGASIGDAQMADTLIELVKTSGLPEGCLNFEITETAVVRKINDAKRLISALRDMGCRFALDDFGSGLSSFGYLKQFKVDLLKIDGQFIKDITVDRTDRIFVKSLIDIAHTLNLETVAEFVESDEILDAVQALGSDYAQGFGIHRPEPLESLIAAGAAERVVRQN